jgi:putative hemolysin
LDYLARKGDRRAVTVSKLIREPDELISGILICNTIANTVSPILVAAIAIRIFDIRTGFIVASISMTIYILFMGEIIPKIIAAQFSEKVSFFVAKPAEVMMRIVFPLVRVVTAITDGIFSTLGVKLERPRPRITRDELKHFVKISGEEGFIAPDEHEMLYAVFSFSDKLAGQVMLPREMIVGVNIKRPIEEIMQMVSEHGYTRYPVYEENLDNIIGILHSKDLFSAILYREAIVLQDLLRPPMFVSKDMKVSRLLKSFQKQRFHIAIVKDENGKVAGIITMEDILEEIVGEIEDEYDVTR